MPEALAVLLVFAVCVFVYVAAWIQTRGSGGARSAADVERLQLHEAWLRERLLRAERETWDDDMIARIAAELRATSRELDRVRVR
jgi:hypothetical protein